MADLHFMEKNPSESEHNPFYREMGFTAGRHLEVQTRENKNTEKRIK